MSPRVPEPIHLSGYWLRTNVVDVAVVVAASAAASREF